MNKRVLGIVLMAAAAAGAVAAVVWWRPFSPGGPGQEGDRTGQYAGTASCRPCHEEFYKLWAPSHHGKAMQPFTAEFAQEELTPQEDEIAIGEKKYRAEFADGAGRVVQTGPDGEKTYPMQHVLGGKNVYYFLTPMERGRLQVLPVAYDVRSKRWYDMAASGLRHVEGGPPDSPLPWTDPAFTFNTACFSCHVSQLATNYDPVTDTYRTVWAEPGINCETCHGPAAEHVRVCEAAPEGEPPLDLKIIQTGTFTHDQHNDTCSPCHAKMMPLTMTFRPGDRYFDHYDLVTLEDPDFYPDGRDLGENYTLTSWRHSPCAQSGQLNCTHCHTSSGRNRFTGENANRACLPCHAERVQNPQKHTNHPPDKGAWRCISCHMPTTRFAGMMRSDHSMRPPTPATMIRFKSPVACKTCHTKPEHDAAWLDKQVRKWRTRDYQAPVLARGELIDAARKQNWSKLDAMLAYITGQGREEIFATGLIRLLVSCRDGRKWPAILKAMNDPSPLVRSAAATALVDCPTEEARDALLKAAGDDYRVVRIRAAGALAGYPRHLLTSDDRKRLDRATKEFEASMSCRPDDWASHYNMGNYRSTLGDVPGALTSYRTAVKLRPDALPPLVNASMIYAQQGNMPEAERLLSRAAQLAPANAAVNFNLGLLLAGKGDVARAEKHLRAALKADPTFTEAAYNLSILLSKDRMPEAIRFCRKAAELQPNSPKYAYTLGFFLHQSGDADGAIRVLTKLIGTNPAQGDAYGLLGMIYEKQGKIEQARDVYRRATVNMALPTPDRLRFQKQMQSLPRK